MIKHTVDSFYVLYVLSAGLIDDIDMCLSKIEAESWSSLPIQVQIISLAPPCISPDDQDTVQKLKEIDRLNTLAGWPQFVVSFYDQIKRKFPPSPTMKPQYHHALERLKLESVLRVPSDIAKFCFKNKIDCSKYSHNKNLTNATQSQQYIIECVD